MSVSGYFTKRRPELRMPRRKGRQPNGFLPEGPVMSGQISVNQAFARDKDAQAQHTVRTYLKTGIGCYHSPEEYDPVLRAHLGMEEKVATR